MIHFVIWERHGLYPLIHIRSVREEKSNAVYQNEPYQFDAYLILSKVYTEVTSTLDESTNTVSSSSILGLKRKASKKQKTKSSKTRSSSSKEGEVFYFHPEDEILQSQAGSTSFTQFQYSNEISDAQADSKRAFFDAGIIPKVCSYTNWQSLHSRRSS